MLAHQRRGFLRQGGGGLGGRTERRIIDAPQRIAGIEVGAAQDDVAIGRRIGADDDLRALPRRREARRLYTFAARGGRLF
jgi:hypothetical protein